MKQFVLSTGRQLGGNLAYIRMLTVKALKRSGVAFAAVTATGAFVSVIKRDIILRYLHDITCGLAQKLAVRGGSQMYIQLQ